MSTACLVVERPGGDCSVAGRNHTGVAEEIGIACFNGFSAAFRICYMNSRRREDHMLRREKKHSARSYEPSCERVDGEKLEHWNC